MRRPLLEDIHDTAYDAALFLDQVTCYCGPTAAPPTATAWTGTDRAGPLGWFWWRAPSKPEGAYVPFGWVALSRSRLGAQRPGACPAGLLCRRQVVPLRPSQVSPCEVVSRPVPGGDPGFL